MRKTGIASPYTSATRIAKDVRASLSKAVDSRMPPPSASTRMINRARAGIFKQWKEPATFSELIIPEELKFLADGTNFILFDTAIPEKDEDGNDLPLEFEGAAGEKRIMEYGTEADLERMANSTE